MLGIGCKRHLGYESKNKNVRMQENTCTKTLAQKCMCTRVELLNIGGGQPPPKFIIEKIVFKY